MYHTQISSNLNEKLGVAIINSFLHPKVIQELEKIETTWLLQTNFPIHGFFPMESRIIELKTRKDPSWKNWRKDLLEEIHTCREYCLNKGYEITGTDLILLSEEIKYIIVRDMQYLYRKSGILDKISWPDNDYTTSIIIDQFAERIGFEIFNTRYFSRIVHYIYFYDIRVDLSSSAQNLLTK